MSPLTELVTEFELNVRAQADAIARGDSKSGNKYAKKYIEAFEELRRHGDAGRAALLPLLSHYRSEVRVMSAAYLLRYRTEDAKAVLEREASGKGLTAFAAGQALRRWEEGSWSLDPV